MKNKNFHFLIALLLTAVVSTSVASESSLDNQILKIKPQADLNGDGKLSDAEKAAMKKIIINRFPRSDSDRDGDLSEKELEVVVRIATVRAKKQGTHGQGKKTNQGKERRTPTHANVKYGKMSVMFSTPGWRRATSQPRWRSISMAEAFVQAVRKN